MAKESIGIFENNGYASMVRIGQYSPLSLERGQIDKFAPKIELLMSGERASVYVMPGTPFLRPISLPCVEPSKIRRLIEFEARQELKPSELEEAAWDYHICKGERSLGEEIDVRFAAMRKEIVDEKVAELGSRRIPITAITPHTEALACFNTQGFLFYAIGNTYVVMFIDGDRYVAKDISAEEQALIRPEDGFSYTFSEFKKIQGLWKEKGMIWDLGKLNEVHYIGIEDEILRKLEEDGKKIHELKHDGFSGDIADHIAVGAALAGLSGPKINLFGRQVPNPVERVQELAGKIRRRIHWPL